MRYCDVPSSMKSRKKRPATHRQLVGNVVRQRRRQLGLSQEGLAEVVNCHRNYIGNVERGEQNFTIDMLLRLVYALECTVADILPQAGI